MKYYRIADLNVALQCETKTEKRAEKYLCNDFEKADIEIISDKADITSRAEKRGLSYDVAAYLIEGREFCKQLLDFNGVYFHSSAVVVDNKAYLFSAPSGTGKSTHTGEWLKLFGDKAYILNDDKPVVRVLSNGIYAYGTPWSGKHDISVNRRVPLQGICFLERGEQNKIELMPKQEAIVRLFHASMHQLNRENAQKELCILEKIITRIPIYKMQCLPNTEAAEMAYNFMSKAEVK